MSPIPIILDDREQASGLPDALRRIGRPSEIARLPLGDIVIGDRLLIERKQTADLAASLRDGRMETQISRLAVHRKRAHIEILVIVEGAISPTALPGFALEPLRQAILSIQFDWRLALVRTENVAETAEWIAAMAQRFETDRPPLASAYNSTSPRNSRSSPGAASHAVHRGPKPVRSPMNLQFAALARVPGLGPAKARSLLDRFGNMNALQAAPESEWLAVPGIGPELARSLADFFGRGRARS